MKLTVLLLFLGLAVNSYAQNQYSSGGSSSVAPKNSAPVEVSPYAITERGPHHHVWQRVMVQTNSAGTTVYQTNSYTELATGMCFWNGNQWVDSSDQIQLAANGATATTTQHHVGFAPNINSAGAINMTTPDNRQMASQVLGLAYLDGDTGSNVLFAGIQDSIGQLLPSGNQVIYTNAFANAEADVLYSQKLSGMEQDVVLRRQLPSASTYGLNGSNIWLQVWTEFTAAPVPQITLPEGGGDSFLDFGAMKMGSGKAFMLGNSSSTVPVIKEWVNAQGRTILIESVLLSSVATQLATLPALSPSSNGSNSVPASTSGQAKIHHVHPSYALLSPPHPNLRNLNLPAPISARKSSTPMHMAAAVSTPKGFVLDYNIVNGNQTNIIFQSDSTYYITNSVNLYGTCILEGGTVIKYSTNISASIEVSHYTNLVCSTAPYRPAIFTAQDDDSVGDQISGSTGTPSGYYGGAGIYASPAAGSGSTPVWSHLRFSWLRQAIVLENDSSAQIYDAQFINCQEGIYMDTVILHLRNSLFSNVTTNFYCVPEPADFDLQNVTVDGGSCLCTIEGYESYPWDDLGGSSPPFYMHVTNCILIGPPSSLGVGLTIPGDPNVSVTDTIITNSDLGIFQTAGAGAFYLASNSPYQGIGTTNIDTNLLADLSQKTTHPPMVFAPGPWSNSFTISPQAPRDAGSSLDLGYHYDPIDYAFGGNYITNSTVTVVPGTVIACYNANSDYGLSVTAGGQFLCQGAPNNLCRIVNLDTVQEPSNTNWTAIPPGSAFIYTDFFGGSPSAVINCRFVDLSILAQDCYFVYGPDIGSSETPNFQDCQFHGGSINTQIGLNLTNCLLERVASVIKDFTVGYSSYIGNCLFWRGSLKMGSAPFYGTIQNNLFDQVQIKDGGGYTYGYNGFNYTNSTNFLSLTNSADVFMTNMSYQTSWLGNYYQPSSSTLINKGSTTADQLGLYYYTTQTNQVPETNSPVDIGYHYVALGANNQPLATLGSGVTNYLEFPGGISITIQIPTNGTTVQ